MATPPASLDLNATLADLRRDEALRLKPYRCAAGKLTIGVGRNLDDVGISVEEAEYLLRNDVAHVLSQLDRALPWWRTLDPVRQRVLVNMAFNLGIGGLMGFTTTLSRVAEGDYARAAAGMLNSLWAGQVGARAGRLAEMMRTGVAP